MDVQVIDNSQEVREAKNEILARVLEIIGIKAEGYAKDIITAASRVDTGNMRNSVTHDISVEEGMICVGTNTEYAV